MMAIPSGAGAEPSTARNLQPWLCAIGVERSDIVSHGTKKCHSSAEALNPDGVISLISD